MNKYTNLKQETLPTKSDCIMGQPSLSYNLTSIQHELTSLYNLAENLNQLKHKLHGQECIFEHIDLDKQDYDCEWSLNSQINSIKNNLSTLTNYYVNTITEIQKGL